MATSATVTACIMCGLSPPEAPAKAERPLPVTMLSDDPIVQDELRRDRATAFWQRRAMAKHNGPLPF